MQINITGFLNAKGSRIFMAELWGHLTAAQETPDGIPPALLEMKKAQLLKQKEIEEGEARRRAERPDFGTRRRSAACPSLLIPSSRRPGAQGGPRGRRR